MGLLGQCYIKNYPIKGIPNETINLKLDIYVAENDQNKINISDEEIRLVAENVNKIWNAYGINFNINRLERFIVNNNLVHGENIKELANDVGKGHLYKDEDKNIDVILIPEFKTRLWILDLGNLFGLEGFYLDSFPSDNRTISLIVIGTNDVKNETWVIAHELGHLLGSYDYPYYSGQFNLMTHSGCIKERYHPTILNQNQVDSAIRNAKTFTENG